MDAGRIRAAPGGLLRESLEDYARATNDFIAATDAVPTAAWARPRMEGKWSPAQEVEHITLAHELFGAQLAGAAPMRVLITGWRGVLVRSLVLPWILRTGRFPRARAPREARPSPAPIDREVLMTRLEAAATMISADLERRGAAAHTTRLDHPYFGAMSLAQTLRLTTVHTRHHRRMLPGGAAAPR